MPSSFAIGWSPPVRSMIASRRAAMPTGPSTMRALRVRAAVDERRRHRAQPLGVDRRRVSDAIPQIPHMASQSRDGVRSVWPSTRKPVDERASAGRAGPSGRRSTRGRARASRPSTSRSRAAPARTRSARAGRRAAASRPAGRCASSAKKRGRIGRGPTNDMSPRSTFQSCGISSSCERLQPAADPRQLASAFACTSSLAEVLADALLGAGPHRPELQHLRRSGRGGRRARRGRAPAGRSSRARRARSRARTAAASRPKRPAKRMSSVRSSTSMRRCCASAASRV